MLLRNRLMSLLVTMIEYLFQRSFLSNRDHVTLGFVESLNNEIPRIQRRANGFRDKEYFRLKILTRMLTPPTHTANLSTTILHEGQIFKIRSSS